MRGVLPHGERPPGSIGRWKPWQCLPAGSCFDLVALVLKRRILVVVEEADH